MQVNHFINGGFVVHKITGNFVGRMSAWFDKDGNVIDAEQICVVFGPSRPVKHGGPMWQRAREVGQRQAQLNRDTA